MLDSELTDMDHTMTPLVRQPRGYELLWRDESDREDHCLSIWRPVPFPGYILLTKLLCFSIGHKYLALFSDFL